MNKENNMGFIYYGPTPDLRCGVCGWILASSDVKKIHPGRILHKDWEEESYGLSGPFKFTRRKTVIVCPEHQAMYEERGFYLASWWGKDGIVHGTK